jgi:hypothetical protein
MQYYFFVFKMVSTIKMRYFYPILSRISDEMGWVVVVVLPLFFGSLNANIFIAN